MDNDVIAADMPELMDQLAYMNANGANLTPAELIMDTMLRGLQAIFDEKLDGHYYTVRRVDDGFIVYDFINQPTGSLTNAQFNFVTAFENQAPFLWDTLEREAVKILGR